MESQNRSIWVDIAKLMAILAVIIDHTNGILYHNQKIAFFSYYSVSLFIIIMGVTSYWSYHKNSENILKKVLSSSWKILRPYLVASIIYEIIIDRQFNLSNYLIHVIHFDASGPFYYVLLYLQLLFLAPILYSFIEYSSQHKHNVLFILLGTITILIISSFTTNYTNILNVYGGGGKLFGGTYLLLLYLGMLFGKYNSRISLSTTLNYVAFIISFICSLAWWNFITIDNCKIDSLLPFGMGFNPPSISFSLYAILCTITIFFFEKAIKHLKLANNVITKFSVLGKHTLYIFLYHRLFIDFAFPFFIISSKYTISNIWLLRFIYFISMIGGSCIIEKILESFHKLVLQTYNMK
jgi:fucose 4-O-acetylase-like acetyltransferase